MSPDENRSSTIWHQYPITVYPHHTDCAGVVWHGTYLTWLEEARVDCLASIGVAYSDFTALGVDMVVIEIKSLHYRQPLMLGEKAIVSTHMTLDGLKIWWDYRIESKDASKVYMDGLLALTAIDRASGRIMRRLPPTVKDALDKLSSCSGV